MVIALLGMGCTCGLCGSARIKLQMLQSYSPNAGRPPSTLTENMSIHFKF